MSHPCHHDCTDFPETDSTDLGCCAPYPLRRSCEAPILPTPNCDEQDPVVTFDEDTETFTITSIMFTNECSQWLTKDGDPWLAKIA